MSKSEWKPLTAATFADFEALFGKRGACGGCWCMWYRLGHRDYEASKGAANKRAMRRLAESKPPPGLMLYVDGEPAGWCSLAPRDVFARLKTSRVLAPVDEKVVWSIVCLFIAKDHRGCGLTGALIRAAVAFARQHGASVLEAYPQIPKEKKLPAVFAGAGFLTSYTDAGFREVIRRSETRAIVRLHLADG